VTEMAYLSMGSNLGDREGNLRAAIEALEREVEIQALSSLYDTAPVGVTDQPRFLNLAAAVRTDLEPPDLLALVKRVEAEVGRRPTYRWGPRVVDIDILLYGDLVLDTPDLVVPHQEMDGRAFVLLPLAEIAPDVTHPILGATVAELAAGVDTGGVRPVGSYGDPNRSSAHGSPSM
jgi:2-amino-4-hydroxy-6-hydroxymethyldihydropteridine diphosphokinase